MLGLVRYRMILDKLLLTSCLLILSAENGGSRRRWTGSYRWTDRSPLSETGRISTRISIPNAADTSKRSYHKIKNDNEQQRKTYDINLSNSGTDIIRFNNDLQAEPTGKHIFTTLNEDEVKNDPGMISWNLGRLDPNILEENGVRTHGTNGDLETKIPLIEMNIDNKSFIGRKGPSIFSWLNNGKDKSHIKDFEAVNVSWHEPVLPNNNHIQRKPFINKNISKLEEIHSRIPAPLGEKSMYEGPTIDSSKRTTPVYKPYPHFLPLERWGQNKNSDTSSQFPTQKWIEDNELEANLLPDYQGNDHLTRWNKASDTTEHQTSRVNIGSPQESIIMKEENNQNVEIPNINNNYNFNFKSLPPNDDHTLMRPTLEDVTENGHERRGSEIVPSSYSWKDPKKLSQPRNGKPIDEPLPISSQTEDENNKNPGMFSWSFGMQKPVIPEEGEVRNHRNKNTESIKSRTGMSLIDSMLGHGDSYKRKNSPSAFRSMKNGKDDPHPSESEEASLDFGWTTQPKTNANHIPRTTPSNVEKPKEEGLLSRISTMWDKDSPTPNVGNIIENSKIDSSNYNPLPHLLPLIREGEDINSGVNSHLPSNMWLGGNRGEKDFSAGLPEYKNRFSWNYPITPIEKHPPIMNADNNEVPYEPTTPNRMSSMMSPDFTFPDVGARAVYSPKQENNATPPGTNPEVKRISKGLHPDEDTLGFGKVRFGKRVDSQFNSPDHGEDISHNVWGTHTQSPQGDIQRALPTDDSKLVNPVIDSGMSEPKIQAPSVDFSIFSHGTRPTDKPKTKEDPKSTDCVYDIRASTENTIPFNFWSSASDEPNLRSPSVPGRKIDFISPTQSGENALDVPRKTEHIAGAPEKPRFLSRFAVGWNRNVETPNMNNNDIYNLKGPLPKGDMTLTRPAINDDTENGHRRGGSVLFPSSFSWNNAEHNLHSSGSPQVPEHLSQPRNGKPIDEPLPISSQTEDEKKKIPGVFSWRFGMQKPVIPEEGEVLIHRNNNSESIKFRPEMSLKDHKTEVAGASRRMNSPGTFRSMKNGEDKPHPNESEKSSVENALDVPRKSGDIEGASEKPEFLSRFASELNQNVQTRNINNNDIFNFKGPLPKDEITLTRPTHKEVTESVHRRGGSELIPSSFSWSTAEHKLLSSESVQGPERLNHPKNGKPIDEPLPISSQTQDADNKNPRMFSWSFGMRKPVIPEEGKVLNHRNANIEPTKPRPGMSLIDPKQEDEDSSKERNSPSTFRSMKNGEDNPHPSESEEASLDFGWTTQPKSNANHIPRTSPSNVEKPKEEGLLSRISTLWDKDAPTPNVGNLIENTQKVSSNYNPLPHLLPLITEGEDINSGVYSHFPSNMWLGGNRGEKDFSAGLPEDKNRFSWNYPITPIEKHPLTMNADNNEISYEPTTPNRMSSIMSPDYTFPDVGASPVYPPKEDNNAKPPGTHPEVKRISKRLHTNEGALGFGTVRFGNSVDSELNSRDHGEDITHNVWGTHTQSPEGDIQRTLPVDDSKLAKPEIDSGMSKPKTQGPSIDLSIFSHGTPPSDKFKAKEDPESANGVPDIALNTGSSIPFNFLSPVIDELNVRQPVVPGRKIDFISPTPTGENALEVSRKTGDVEGAPEDHGFLSRFSSGWNQNVQTPNMSDNNIFNFKGVTPNNDPMLTRPAGKEVTETGHGRRGTELFPSSFSWSNTEHNLPSSESVQDAERLNHPKNGKPIDDPFPISSQTQDEDNKTPGMFSWSFGMRKPVIPEEGEVHNNQNTNTEPIKSRQGMTFMTPDLTFPDIGANVVNFPKDVNNTTPPWNNMDIERSTIDLHPDEGSLGYGKSGASEFISPDHGQDINHNLWGTHTQSPEGDIQRPVPVDGSNLVKPVIDSRISKPKTQGPSIDFSIFSFGAPSSDKPKTKEDPESTGIPLSTGNSTPFNFWSPVIDEKNLIPPSVPGRKIDFISPTPSGESELEVSRKTGDKEGAPEDHGFLSRFASGWNLNVQTPNMNDNNIFNFKGVTPNNDLMLTRPAGKEVTENGHGRRGSELFPSSFSWSNTEHNLPSSESVQEAERLDHPKNGKPIDDPYPISSQKDDENNKTPGMFSWSFGMHKSYIPEDGDVLIHRNNNTDPIKFRPGLSLIGHKTEDAGSSRRMNSPSSFRSTTNGETNPHSNESEEAAGENAFDVPRISGDIERAPEKPGLLSRFASGWNLNDQAPNMSNNDIFNFKGPLPKQDITLTPPAINDETENGHRRGGSELFPSSFSWKNAEHNLPLSGSAQVPEPLSQPRNEKPIDEPLHIGSKKEDENNKIPGMFSWSFGMQKPVIPKEGEVLFHRNNNTENIKFRPGMSLIDHKTEDAGTSRKINSPSTFKSTKNWEDNPHPNESEEVSGENALDVPRISLDIKRAPEKPGFLSRFASGWNLNDQAPNMNHNDIFNFKGPLPKHDITLTPPAINEETENGHGRRGTELFPSSFSWSNTEHNLPSSESVQDAERLDHPKNGKPIDDPFPISSQKDDENNKTPGMFSWSFGMHKPYIPEDGDVLIHRNNNTDPIKFRPGLSLIDHKTEDAGSSRRINSPSTFRSTTNVDTNLHPNESDESSGENAFDVPRISGDVERAPEKPGFLSRFASGWNLNDQAPNMSNNDIFDFKGPLPKHDITLMPPAINDETENGHRRGGSELFPSSFPWKNAEHNLPLSGSAKVPEPLSQPRNEKPIDEPLHIGSKTEDENNKIPGMFSWSFGMQKPVIPKEGEVLFHRNNNTEPLKFRPGMSLIDHKTEDAGASRRMNSPSTLKTMKNGEDNPHPNEDIERAPEKPGFLSRFASGWNLNDQAPNMSNNEIFNFKGPPPKDDITLTRPAHKEVTENGHRRGGSELIPSSLSWSNAEHNLPSSGYDQDPERLNHQKNGNPIEEPLPISSETQDGDNKNPEMFSWSFGMRKPVIFEEEEVLKNRNTNTEPIKSRPEMTFMTPEVTFPDIGANVDNFPKQVDNTTPPGNNLDIERSTIDLHPDEGGLGYGNSGASAFISPDHGGDINHNFWGTHTQSPEGDIPVQRPVPVDGSNFVKPVIDSRMSKPKTQGPSIDVNIYRYGTPPSDKSKTKEDHESAAGISDIPLSTGNSIPFNFWSPVTDEAYLRPPTVPGRKIDFISPTPSGENSLEVSRNTGDIERPPEDPGFLSRFTSRWKQNVQTPNMNKNGIFNFKGALPKDDIRLTRPAHNEKAENGHRRGGSELFPTSFSWSNAEHNLHSSGSPQVPEHLSQPRNGEPIDEPLPISSQTEDEKNKTPGLFSWSFGMRKPFIPEKGDILYQCNTNNEPKKFQSGISLIDHKTGDGGSSRRMNSPSTFRSMNNGEDNPHPNQSEEESGEHALDFPRKSGDIEGAPEKPGFLSRFASGWNLNEQTPNMNNKNISYFKGPPPKEDITLTRPAHKEVTENGHRRGGSEHIPSSFSWSNAEHNLPSSESVQDPERLNHPNNEKPIDEPLPISSQTLDEDNKIPKMFSWGFGMRKPVIPEEGEVLNHRNTNIEPIKSRPGMSLKDPILEDGDSSKGKNSPSTFGSMKNGEDNPHTNESEEASLHFGWTTLPKSNANHSPRTSPSNVEKPKEEGLLSRISTLWDKDTSTPNGGNIIENSKIDSSNYNPLPHLLPLIRRGENINSGVNSHLPSNMWLGGNRGENDFLPGLPEDKNCFSWNSAITALEKHPPTMNADNNEVPYEPTTPNRMSSMMSPDFTFPDVGAGAVYSPKQENNATPPGTNPEVKRISKGLHPDEDTLGFGTVRFGKSVDSQLNSPDHNVWGTHSQSPGGDIERALPTDDSSLVKPVIDSGMSNIKIQGPSIDFSIFSHGTPPSDKPRTKEDPKSVDGVYDIPKSTENIIPFNFWSSVSDDSNMRSPSASGKIDFISPTHSGENALDVPRKTGDIEGAPDKPGFLSRFAVGWNRNAETPSIYNNFNLKGVTPNNDLKITLPARKEVRENGHGRGGSELFPSSFSWSNTEHNLPPSESVQDPERLNQPRNGKPLDKPLPISSQTQDEDNKNPGMFSWSFGMRKPVTPVEGEVHNDRNINTEPIKSQPGLKFMTPDFTFPGIGANVVNFPKHVDNTTPPGNNLDIERSMIDLHPNKGSFGFGKNVDSELNSRDHGEDISHNVWGTDTPSPEGDIQRALPTDDSTLDKPVIDSGMSKPKIEGPSIDFSIFSHGTPPSDKPKTKEDPKSVDGVYDIPTSTENSIPFNFWPSVSDESNLRSTSVPGRKIDFISPTHSGVNALDVPRKAGDIEGAPDKPGFLSRFAVGWNRNAKTPNINSNNNFNFKGVTPNNDLKLTRPAHKEERGNGHGRGGSVLFPSSFSWSNIEHNLLPLESLQDPERLSHPRNGEHIAEPLPISSQTQDKDNKNPGMFSWSFGMRKPVIPEEEEVHNDRNTNTEPIKSWPGMSLIDPMLEDGNSSKGMNSPSIFRSMKNREDNPHPNKSREAPLHFGWTMQPKSNAYHIDMTSPSNVEKPKEDGLLSRISTLWDNDAPTRNGGHIVDNSKMVSSNYIPLPHLLPLISEGEYVNSGVKRHFPLNMRLAGNRGEKNVLSGLQEDKDSFNWNSASRPSEKHPPTMNADNEISYDSTTPIRIMEVL